MIEKQIRNWKSDTGEGLSVKTSKGILVVLQTKTASEDVIVPRFWVDSLLNEEFLLLEEKEQLIEEAEGEALQSFSTDSCVPSDIAEWCEKVYDLAKLAYNAMSSQNFQSIDFTVNHITIGITPIKSENSLISKTVEYYLSDDELIGDSNSLYQIASRLQNYDKHSKERERQKEMLQDFFEEKILPLIKKSSFELTAEQKTDFQLFSDWHKSVYGNRPYNHSNNKCIKRLLQNRKEGNTHERE